MFSTQEVIRYSKQIMLDDLGLEGQEMLNRARIVVIGAGGLGCPILQYLNAVGIGTIGIVEFDTVDITNLHRQILYTPPDVGCKKIDIAVEWLNRQNPNTHFIKHDAKVDASNVFSILNDYDVVIDGCDNFETRYLINDACVHLAKPLIYGSILGYQGQVAVFNHKGSKNLRDIFPTPPDAADVPSCSENGVMGTVPGIIGLIMAQAAINVVLQQPSYENQFVLFNTLNMERTVLEF